jgi:molybdopterin molybdotransferase
MQKNIPVSAPGCDDHDPTLLRVEQVHEKLAQLVTPVSGSERVAIRSALGRILAEPIISSINVPPYANSAMDGYAVRSADLPAQGEQSLKVIGSSFAGEPFRGEIKTGECVRIMTGAKIPDGADCVIMQEHTQRNDNNITIGSGHCAGQNLRHPGEDMRIGSEVLRSGQRIGPAEIGLMASLGIAEVTVKRQLRVAFFSTGDELRGVGEILAEGQIYDSNRYTLFGMLQELGVSLIDMGVIRDDQTAVEQAFMHAASIADVVITSGGVSVGEADYVKLTLDKLGQVGFWRIAMKPGKPLAFGKVGTAVFFGLPGNPVSVMATFYLFALPALRHMMGQPYQQPLVYRARTQTRLKKAPGRTDYQRGVLHNDHGTLTVDATGMQASHILSGMSRANCFIVLPLEAGPIEAGTEVDVIPFHGLIG